MSSTSDQVSCKRKADAVDENNMPPQPAPKRSKNSNIMDFMKPKPQSRNRPQHRPHDRSAETTSKYWAKSQDDSKGKGSQASNSKDDRQVYPKATNKDSTSGPPYDDDSDSKSTSSSKSNTLHLKESTGDIFSAPPQTLLIHACNCEGSWGAGIALAFKKAYPNAFKIYAAHCKDHGSDLFGTALLIPPQNPDYAKKNQKPHFVGCLFTSRSKGKKKDSPEQILNATGPAVMDLLAQVREWNAKAEYGRRVGEVRMCKINSGLFAVPWEDTMAVIEEIEVAEGDFREVKVVSREE